MGLVRGELLVRVRDLRIKPQGLGEFRAGFLMFAKLGQGLAHQPVCFRIVRRVLQRRFQFVLRLGGLPLVKQNRSQLVAGFHIGRIQMEGSLDFRRSFDRLAGLAKRVPEKRMGVGKLRNNFNRPPQMQNRFRDISMIGQISPIRGVSDKII